MKGVLEMEGLKQTVRQLCEATGVAGREDGASRLAADLLRPYMDEVRTDALGNVIGLRRSGFSGAKTLLLDAHIDEIGLVVTSIDDRGFLKFGPCGGVDRRMLAAQTVVVHGKQPITGIIGLKPPHLEGKEEANRPTPLDEMYIDLGRSKEETEALVSLGDPITFTPAFLTLSGDRVSCKALDDRCGVAAILHALSLLSGKPLAVDLAVCFSTREELGEQGARVAAYGIRPDEAIAVDVSFALTPDSDPLHCGEMGKGCMVGYHASLPRQMSDGLVALCEAEGIPYQYEIMDGRSTGTNADEIMLTGNGVVTGVVSIPQKYMHTPIEQVALSDVEATARLLAAWVRQGGNLA